MRIAYVLERNLCLEDGVIKKIAGQTGAWRRLGHETGLFALVRSPGVAQPLADVVAATEHWRGPWDWLGRYGRLIDAALSWRPDVAYFRFAKYFPALGRLLRAVPTVLEINTDDLREYRNSMSWYTYAYHKRTRDKLFGHCRGLVTPTHELAAVCRQFDKPTAVIANGIDLSLSEPLPAPNNAAPRLIFLGSPDNPWHGVDKIVRLAAANARWHFDLVGDKTFGLPLPPANVTMHDRMSAAEYEPLLAAADVAIGTLALHRNGMDEASPLKTREYLARGLPTIIAYRDTDFPNDAPFLLRLPNTPDNVEDQSAAIRQFVAAARGMRVPRADIQQIDLGAKEQRRLEFFKSIVGTG
jgi:glycosyltransferase involved in cell wall biosynthesis